MQLFQAELRTAIGQGDRCTLCWLVADADRSHMRSFLREHGSDPLVLEPIYAAWGFCAWHTWALALMEDRERGGVLAMALLADDLMRHLASIAKTSESSEGASSTANRPLPIPSSPGPDSTCEMCHAMREEERYWVKHLTDARTFSAGDLAALPRFCAPHLRVLKEGAREASEMRAHIAGRWRIWRMMLHRIFARGAPQQARQAHDAISLQPLEENAGTVEQVVARACGVRELTTRLSYEGDALAPLDDTSSRPPDSDSVTCAVCAAEISAAHATCQQLLTEFGAIRIAQRAIAGLCHGHRWLLADMAASGARAGENVDFTQAGQATPSSATVAAESICVVCHVCWDAASEMLRARACNAPTEKPEVGIGSLCLAHWSAAERILSERGCEGEHLKVRQVQRRYLEKAREDLRRYLDYFSVSTRDPDAPPPGTFAWRQAVTLLVGMCPQGQCRACGDP